MKDNKGFDVVELILVIAIISILSAIFIPNVIEYNNKVKYKNDDSVTCTKLPNLKNKTINSKQQNNYYIENVEKFYNITNKKQDIKSKRKIFAWENRLREDDGKIIAIIQATTENTNFPNKMIKQINGKSILEIIINRVSMSDVDDIVIITTKNSSDDIIKKIANDLGYMCFRNYKKSISLHMEYLADKYNANLIVDIPNDSILIDHKHINSLISYHYKYFIDYSSNYEEITFSDGFDVQVYTIDALKGTSGIYNQQPGYNLSQHPGSRNKTLKADKELYYPCWNLALNKKSDFVLIEKIFKHFGDGYFSYEQIIKYLEDNQELLEINKDIKRKDTQNG